jgi:hypothetical protein
MSPASTPAPTSAFAMAKRNVLGEQPAQRLLAKHANLLSDLTRQCWIVPASHEPAPCLAAPAAIKRTAPSMSTRLLKPFDPGPALRWRADPEVAGSRMARCETVCEVRMARREPSAAPAGGTLTGRPPSL